MDKTKNPQPKQSMTTRKSHKAKNREIAESTLKILNQGWYHYCINQDLYQYEGCVNNQVDQTSDGEEKVIVSLAHEQERAVAETILYTPEQKPGNPQLQQADRKTSSKKGVEQYQTVIEVNDLTSLDAVRKLTSEIQEEGEDGGEEESSQVSETQQKAQSRILCLNFASGKNAGGGFLRGSAAQEESIARATGLYPCLTQESMRGYYDANRDARAPFYTDHMIYSPDVPVFKNEDGSLMEKPMLVSFLTAPAVNVSVERNRKGKTNRKGKGGLNNSMVESIMRRRIARVFRIAKERGHEHLVLGAWGCGVFGNDPRDVARWFSEELKSFQFRKIVFAIYSSNMNFHKAFLWEFKRCGLEALEDTLEDEEDED